MIYTVTFNPALDVSGVVEEIIPDEKCYVNNEIKCAGGNGINAGIVASRLGAKVLLTGFLGGVNGQEIRRLLNEEKNICRFISIENETRMNVTISNLQTNKQTRLSFPGPRIHKLEWSRLRSYLEGLESRNRIMIIGGSLPPGVSSSMVNSLVRDLSAKGFYVMVDMPSQNLKRIIKAKPDFIKPNLKEFQELTHSRVYKKASVIKMIRGLLDYVPLICVSSVEGGAILASKDEAWFGITPKLSIRSTVGAGDSMVGAIATELIKPEYRLNRALQLGLAASCATLTEPGLTLGQKSSIEKFFTKIKIQKLY